jgi:bifunctional NMN adenylyltransferase/nudix hydrolase
VYDTAILIGRFQPVHNGHLALLRDALAVARRVVVVVGSACAARSPRNPFTWRERADLLLEAFAEPERARIDTLPVRDYYDEPVWARAVAGQVHALLGSAAASICLVGHFKDASSGYLRSFPDWPLRALPRQGHFDATALRDAWLGGAAPATLADALPAHAVAFLQDFARTPAFCLLQQDWQALKDSKAAWACAPYPPTFVTVDALVTAQEQVLLVRRGRSPGQGLLALPGGFIDVHETLLQSCLRELEEETHCALPANQLLAALREVRVFAHPARSERGRTITHVHHFDLGEERPPAVRADDDAALAQWVPIGELAALEDQFFDDHFHVLDRFLGLLGRASMHP